MATLQNIICRLLETRKQHSLFLYVLFTCNYIFQIGIFIYKLPAPHYPQCQARARLFHEASSLAYLVSSCRKLITLAHLQPHPVLGLPGHLSSPWFWLSSVALMKWVRGNSMSLQPGLIFVIALWLWCSASARLTGCPEGTMKIHMQQRLTAEDTPEQWATLDAAGSHGGAQARLHLTSLSFSECGMHRATTVQASQDWFWTRTRIDRWVETESRSRPRCIQNTAHSRHITSNSQGEDTAQGDIWKEIKAWSAPQRGPACPCRRGREGNDGECKPEVHTVLE